MITFLLYILTFSLSANNFHIDKDRVFGFNQTNCFSSDNNNLHFTYLKNINIAESQYKCNLISKSDIKFENLSIKFINANFKDISGDILNSYNIFNFNKIKNKKFNSFKNIKINDIYNKTNLLLNEKNSNYEFSFELEPFSDINNIKLKFDNPQIDEIGNLLVGDFIISKPIAFYKDNPINSNGIEIKYKIENNIVLFEIAEYDISKTIVIDPIVKLRGTYYGGISIDRFYDIDVDESRNSYGTGLTLSTAQIAFNGHQNIKDGNYDAVLVKFDKDGNRKWGTYFGGDYDDIAFSTKHHGSNILMAGRMSSETFTMTSDAHQETFGGADDDGFFADFNEDGELTYATYYGGKQNDAINGIDFENGAVYITGYTRSEENIASGGHQNTFGGLFDAFLVRFEDGIRDWGTYIGGDGQDFGNNLVVKNNKIFIVGSTNSTSNITKNGYNNSINGKFDGFFSEFRIDGQMQRSSYIGGSEDDYAFAADFDGTNIYLLGTTYSSNFPANTHQTSLGGTADNFITKIETNNLLKSTFYGGSLAESSYDLKYNKNNLYIVGATRSDNNINLYANSARQGNFDATLAKFDDNLNVIFSTYLGGVEEDVARSVFATNDSIYIGGYSSSADVFSQNGHQDGNNGETDAFITIYKDNSARNINFELGDKYCVGDEISLEIEVDYDLEQNNIWTVYLSDKEGNLENKSKLKEVESNSTNITFFIPNDLEYSDEYKIEIASSKPFANKISDYIIIYPNLKITNNYETNFCPGENIKLNTNDYPTATTTWYLDDEEIYQGNTIDYSFVNSGTFTLKAIQKNDICESFFEEEIIIKNEITIDIEGNLDVCLNEIEEYTFQTNSENEVKFSLNGANLVSKSENSVRIRWTSLTPSVNFYTEETNTDCASNKWLYPKVSNVISADIFGSDTSCLGCTDEYFIEDRYESINWFVEGGEILTSSTLSKIQVKWENTPAIVRVKYSNGACIDSAYKSLVTEEDAKLKIFPEVEYVCLDEVIKFTTTNADHYSFTWTAFNTDSLYEDGNDVYIRFKNTGDGQITVRRYNSNTDEYEVYSMNFYIYDISNISIDKPKSDYCLNDTISVKNNRSFHKIKIANGDYELISANDSLIQIMYNTIGVKEIEINVSNKTSHCSEDFKYEFTVNPLPERATISEEQGKIVSSANKNIWFEDDKILEDSTNVITPKQNSTYYAFAINEYGCFASIPSNTITFKSSSVINNEVRIYPNPSSDKLNIELENTQSSIDVEIIDFLGNKAFSANYYNKNYVEIKHNLLAGIYIINIKLNNKIYIKEKLIITK